MIDERSVRIRVSRQKLGRYRIKVTIPDGPTIRGEFELDRRFLGRPGAHSTRRLRLTPDALASAVFAEIGRDVRATLPVDSRSYRILLTLNPPELWQLPWEDLAGRWPLDTGSIAASRRIVRYSGYRDPKALTPLTMPLSAALIGRTDRRSRKRERLEKYYRTTEASSTARITNLLVAGQYDIVHLEASPRIDAGGRTRIVVGSDEGVSLAEFGRAMRNSETRVVILEGEPGSRPALLEAAHTIHGRTGPSVIVTEGPADFGAFYYNLLHNSAIDELVQRWLPKGAGLLLSRFGERTLDLDRTARSMTAEVQSSYAAVDAALGTFDALVSRKAGQALRTKVAAMRGARDELDRLQKTMYSFHQDSQGAVPMTEAAEVYGRVLSDVRDLVLRLGRVVNTWFESGDKPVPTTRSLVADGRYELKLNVGLLDPRSVVHAPVEIAEKFLEDKYRDGGVKLRVILSGGDFEIGEPEQELLVPEPPMSSRTITFDIRAPATPGRAVLRAGLYYRNNLLQSILITAAVTTDESDTGSARSGAEVEWTLTGTLRELDRFELRALSLLANDAANGGHVFLVVGDDIKREINLKEGELEKRIAAVRAKLQAVCNTFKSDGQTPDRYRFDSDNRGSEQQFLDDLKELANVGFGLWTELEAGDESWSAKLQDKLRSPAVIQIAGVKSASYVFPWSAVYDLPFLRHSKNRLCPDVADALMDGIDGATLARTACFVAGCAYRDDLKVVCPSGFWGFRHVIEQPLSAVLTNGEHTGGQDGEVAFTIPIASGLRATIGLSQNLRDWKSHGEEAGAVLNGAYGMSSLDDIGEALRSTDLQVVYFYCHGGRASGEAWLGVGTTRQPERIYPQSFRAWKLKWPTIRPLVFINGCKTVGITPDDLLSFNRTLAWCRAAGVVGTEITIPETLAKWFGLEFLKAFKTGGQVGELFRTMRLNLLVRYNPLGLAYTPYCMSTLHLEV